VCNEQLQNVYSSLNIIRKIKNISWAEYVARMGVTRREYRILVGNSEGKRVFERSGPKWEGNITNDLKERGCEVQTKCI
jgi:hypothetical protein